MALQGNIALITGAGAGIGQSISLAMAKAGANIVSADIDMSAAERTAQQATESGIEALAVQADVGNVQEIDEMVKAAVERFGRLDTIVNNAGVTLHAYITDLTEEDWDRIQRINSKGVFFCIQRAALQMIEQRSGSIINMASIAGRGFDRTSNVAYAASKGSVISMTKTSAQQLGKHNINVNAICPGVTRTPMLEALLQDRAEKVGITVEEAMDEISGTIPIRRVNEPDDIASMAVYLASPEARNITGQAFNVDGGLVPS